MGTDKPTILYGFVETKPWDPFTGDREFISVNQITEICYNSESKKWMAHISKERIVEILHPELLGLDKI